MNVTTAAVTMTVKMHRGTCWFPCVSVRRSRDGRSVAGSGQGRFLQAVAGDGGFEGRTDQPVVLPAHRQRRQAEVTLARAEAGQRVYLQDEGFTSVICIQA